MSNPRTIIITGGTKGLGRAAADAFLARVDHVLILTRTSHAATAAAPHTQLRHLVAETAPVHTRGKA